LWSDVMKSICGMTCVPATSRMKTRAIRQYAEVGGRNQPTDSARNAESGS